MPFYSKDKYYPLRCHFHQFLKNKARALCKISHSFKYCLQVSVDAQATRHNLFSEAAVYADEA